MYIVKLAVALLMTGGVSRRDPNGTTVRGESHLLLVGDPGESQSEALELFYQTADAVHLDLKDRASRSF